MSELMDPMRMLALFCDSRDVAVDLYNRKIATLEAELVAAKAEIARLTKDATVESERADHYREQWKQMVALWWRGRERPAL